MASKPAERGRSNSSGPGYLGKVTEGTKSLVSGCGRVMTCACLKPSRRMGPRPDDVSGERCCQMCGHHVCACLQVQVEEIAVVATQPQLREIR
jgi:hypothetical protein